MTPLNIRNPPCRTNILTNAFVIRWMEQFSRPTPPSSWITEVIHMVVYIYIGHLI